MAQKQTTYSGHPKIYTRGDRFKGSSLLKVRAGKRLQVNQREKPRLFDVLFILLHHALQLYGVIILFDAGKGNKQRYINVAELAEELTQQYCAATLSLYMPSVAPIPPLRSRE